MGTKTEIAGFRRVEQRDLPEYGAQASWWKHELTGCEVVHLGCDDPENMFAFGFSTVPPDSSGVAHILEHTVLCGSRSFPLKDPFLRLLQSSAYTFLNAFTFPDKTVYPASSVVEKDYFNLMHVYGDAVFFPLLQEKMFRQEGHRLVYDDQGTLGISGVVYNEMLGAFSSQESVEMRLCLNGLFPDTAYGYESGGDPVNIPELTYQQFLDFHARHYHPANARIVLYGNIEVEKQLHFLQDTFLRHFENGVAVPSIETQPRWSEPRRIEQRVPGDSDPETSSSVSMNWLLFPATDVEQCMAFELLDEVLLGTPGSPLQRKLLASGLGEDLSSVSGFESEIMETMFSVGLRGTSAANTEKIEQCILQSLQEIVDEGLDADLVEGTLRRFEFRLRELVSGGSVGMHIMRRMYQTWMYGASPWDAISLTRVLSDIREKIAQDAGWLTSFITDHLLENSHRLTVTVRPDAKKEQEDQQRLQEYLQNIEAGLSLEQKQQIIDDEKALQQFQQQADSPEAVASLPSLSRSDVPMEIQRIESSTIELEGGVNCILSRLPSRGIVYCNFVFHTEGLSEQAEMLLPLLASCVGGLGTENMTYEQMSHAIGLVFGGFRASVNVVCRLDDAPAVPEFWLTTRFLAPHGREALALVDSVLASLDFSDHTRLREILLEQRNSYRSSIVQHGSGFAVMRADAGLRRQEAVEERLKGISQYAFLDALLQQPIEQLAADLEAVRQKLCVRSRCEIQLTCDDESEFLSYVPSGLSKLWQAEPGGEAAVGISVPLQYPLPAVGKPEALVTSTAVNFMALALPGRTVFEAEYAAQLVLAHLLSTGYLWERCRMQGGAYGASAGVNGLSGIFHFSSYRDPNSEQTMKAFLEAFSILQKDLPDSDVIEKAVISLAAKELRPLNPGSKGMLAYRRKKCGITDEVRQRNREQLLAVVQDSILAELKTLDAQLEKAVASMLVNEKALTGAQETSIMHAAAANRHQIVSG